MSDQKPESSDQEQLSGEEGGGESAKAEESHQSNQMTIKVRTAMDAGEPTELVLEKDATVRDLKQSYMTKKNLSVRRQLYTYMNRKLEGDDSKLSEYNIGNGATVQLQPRIITGTKSGSDDDDKSELLAVIRKSFESVQAMQHLFAQVHQANIRSQAASRSRSTSSMVSEPDTPENRRTRQRMSDLQKRRRLMQRSRSAPVTPIVRSGESSPTGSNSPRACSEPASKEDMSVEEDETFLMDHKYKIPANIVINKAAPAISSELFFDPMESPTQADLSKMETPAENTGQLAKMKLERGQGKPAKKKGLSCSFRTCDRRLHLVQQATGRCRCKGVFCAEHLSPEIHKCKFDFKAEGRRKLAKENPAIGREKGFKDD